MHFLKLFNFLVLRIRSRIRTSKLDPDKSRPDPQHWNFLQQKLAGNVISMCLYLFQRRQDRYCMY